MNKYVKYRTNGICCQMISYDIEGDIVRNIIFHGGCPGGLNALAKSLNGRKIQEVIDLMKNIKCGNRDSSCPNELAKSLQDELNAINSSPEEEQVPFREELLNLLYDFLNRTNLDLSKYKLIIKVRSDVYEEWQEDISNLIESERDIYWYRLKDYTIEASDDIKDKVIFVTEKII